MCVCKSQKKINFIILPPFLPQGGCRDDSLEAPGLPSCSAVSLPRRQVFSGEDLLPEECLRRTRTETSRGLYDVAFDSTKNAYDEHGDSGHSAFGIPHSAFRIPHSVALAFYKYDSYNHIYSFRCIPALAFRHWLYIGIDYAARTYQQQQYLDLYILINSRALEQLLPLAKPDIDSQKWRP